MPASAPAAEAAEQSIEVLIWRGREEGYYQRFTVPLRESQTVLDVVTWVQRNVDPTLAYRFACRVGCAARAP